LLFGHEKGAFPGAFNRHIGALEHDEGGTVVLNEIDRLPASVQLLLAESMQRGEARPLGARRSYNIDVRLIAVSNVSLIELVDSGYFLPAMQKIIANSHVTLPPLRARADDIPVLAHHFLAHISEQLEKHALGITESALALLKTHDWPGNVGQLKAVLFRAAMVCDGGVLTPENFPHLSRMISHNDPFGNVRHDGVGIPLFMTDGHVRPLEDIEADVIRLAISHYRGRMTEIARRLDIGRSTLHRRLIRLGIDGVT
jgi:DNA-binding NtrC family response regulator